jgi:hypothetical protein
MRSIVRWNRRVGIASALMLSACTDKDITAPRVNAKQVISSVTPELAAQLDANGKFVFAAPSGGEVPWITADRARELAVGYWTGYGEGLRRNLGVAENLVPCRRVFFAESAYEEFPPDLTRTSRRSYGPSWIVSLCRGNEQQVAIAVSVLSADLTVDELGIVRGVQSGDFQADAVPVGTTFPLEPELGAVQIAEATGARVSATPRYVRQAKRSNSFSGIWRYPLESTVRLRGVFSGRDIDTDLVAFTRWSSMYDLRPVAANPDSASVERSELLTILVNGTTQTVFEIVRRADVPASVEAVIRRGNP